MSFSNRVLLYVAFCLAPIVGSLEVVRAYVELAKGNNTASHIVLIPLISFALVVQNRKMIFLAPQHDLFVGLPAVLAGLALWWFADSLSASIAAIAILVASGFVLFFGRGAFRAALFPLAFLVFAIPIPPMLIEAAVRILKDGSTEAVAALFTLTGIPYHRAGYIFSLPKFAIEIADECSGIRSSIALLITAALAGHTFLGRYWSRTVLIALVLPVAILKNGIRIVSLSLLAMYVDPRFLAGQLHREGGIVFFLLSLAILAPALTILRRSEAKSASIA